MDMLWNLPDESQVPMSWVKENILEELDQNTEHFAHLAATGSYWADVICGLLPLPFAPTGGAAHSATTETKPHQDLRDKNTEPIVAGRKNWNRVRAFVRNDSPYWYFQWYWDFETGQSDRITRRLTSWDGVPITDRAEAEQVVNIMATKVSQHRHAVETGGGGVQRHGRVDRTALPEGQVFAPMAAERPQDAAPVHENTGPKGRGVSVADGIDTWIRAVEKKGRSKATISNYASTAKRFRAEYGELCIGEVDDTHIADWLEAMDKEGLSASTRKGHHSNISAFFSYMADKRIVHSNPALDVLPPRQPSRKETGKYYTKDELDLLMPVIEARATDRFCMVAGAVHSGSRVAELMKVTPDRVDEHEDGTVVISIGERKNGVDGKVFELEIRHDWAAEAWLNWKESAAPGEKMSDLHERYFASLIRDELREHEEAAGVETIRGRAIYAFKHDFVTTLARARRKHERELIREEDASARAGITGKVASTSYDLGD